MEQGVPQMSVALIVGVTGMVGLSLAESLKKPTALGGPWEAYGAARRSMPTWFPSSTLDHYLTIDATNYTNTIEKLSPLSHQITHLFWLAIQVRETEEENIAVNTLMLQNILNALLSSSPSSSLRHVTIQTGTKQYLGPIFDPTMRNQLVHHDPPFKEESPRLPYPNFYYSLEDLLVSYSPAFTYSIHRSSIIIGGSTRSFYNTLLALSVYATICKYQGLKFLYPGNKYTWDHLCDMADARILAEQQIWAATTNTAKNQAFNCSNGDVFMWKNMWKVLCEIFEVEFVEFEEREKFDWVGEMKEKEKVWDSIVEENGLYKTKLDEITCFGALSVVLHFQIQHVCSMNKSREFGFFGYVDTIKSIRMWVEKLRKMKIIP